MADRILVCDDDPRVRSVLSRLLVREGYVVRMAENGAQALEEIETNPPDVLLLDAAMPGYDGFETLRRARQTPAGALLPIAMITGLSDTASRVRALETGADDFVVKPFEVEVLSARIRSLLRVKHLTDQLERTENVVIALARTVEARDAYTDGHMWRLASYSRTVAIALGNDAQQARDAWYGGLLHDIGKIGIAEEVLKKEGALTPEEFAEVRRHPDVGAAIVAPMRFAARVGPIVRGHHERWDGGGYPGGLAGDAIPLGSRIVAVADAFDAMTTDRPYRPALPHTEAVRRLRAGAGSQWDRAVAEVFLDLLERGELDVSEVRGQVA